MHLDRWPALSALLAIIAVSGCGGASNRLDSRSQSILNGATKVEVFRIDGAGLVEMNHKITDPRSIDGFRVINQQADRGREVAEKLASILSKKDSYSDDYYKCFWPGVAFRVWKDDDALDVLICFKCNNLYCGPPIKSTFENASFLGTPARARLIELAKECFPEDHEIQALAE
jgi:hypothetical protein